MMILTLDILAVYPCHLCSSPNIPGLADALATGQLSGVLELQSNNEPPDTPIYFETVLVCRIALGYFYKIRGMSFRVQTMGSLKWDLARVMTV